MYGGGYSRISLLAEEFFAHHLAGGVVGAYVYTQPAMDPAVTRAVAAGDAAYRTRGIAKAASHFRHAITLCDARGASNTLPAAAVMRKLADCTILLGNNTAGLQMAERALGVVRALDEEDVKVAEVHGLCEQALSGALVGLGRTTEAMDAMRRSLVLHERAASHRGIVTSLIGIARMCSMTGEYETGLQHLSRAEAAVLARGDPDEGMVWLSSLENNRVELLRCLGRPEEALASAKRALTITELTFGKNTPEVAEVLVGLGSSQISAHDVKGGMASYRRAADIFERQGMKNTPSNALVCGKIGVELVAAGRMKEGLQQLNHALKIRRSIQPPDHPDIATLLLQISCAHTVVGNTASADKAAEAHFAAARRSQTQCANPGCVRQLREDGAPLDVCIKCRRTFYCSKVCQTADWRRKGGHGRSARRSSQRIRLQRRGSDYSLTIRAFEGGSATRMHMYTFKI